MRVTPKNHTISMFTAKLLTRLFILLLLFSMAPFLIDKQLSARAEHIYVYLENKWTFIFSWNTLPQLPDPPDNDTAKKVCADRPELDAVAEHNYINYLPYTSVYAPVPPALLSIILVPLADG